MSDFNLTARMAMAAAALLCGAIASAAPARVDQLVRTALELDPNASHGAALYLQNCARCHGQGAIGDPRNVIPALAGQREAYLIKQLADFTELERESQEMHAVVARAALNEPQAWADVATYLSRLPPAPFPETTDGEGVELGEAIFQEQCASCHEEDGAAMTTDSSRRCAISTIRISYDKRAPWPLHIDSTSTPTWFASSTVSTPKRSLPSLITCHGCAVRSAIEQSCATMASYVIERAGLMNPINNILVIVDPTAELHPAVGKVRCSRAG